MTYKSFVCMRATFGALLLASLVLSPLTATGQNEWVVRSFPTNESQGSQPMGNLVADGAGNLYGTTFEGGAFPAWGMVYELVRPVPPKTAWTEKLLYSFSGSPDGGLPMAGLVFDKVGNLYGTTSRGGAFDSGTVFELSPPDTVGGTWTKSTLHSFQPAINDGSSPQSGLVFDNVGNLYGATYTGGAHQTGSCGSRVNHGCGTIFELSPSSTPSGPWTETVLHSFNFGQGAYPKGAPIFDAQGSLYGTCYGGGAFQYGVVYRLTPPGILDADWSYRVLYAFDPMIGSSDGGRPNAALTLHGKKVLYGTTTIGGLHSSGTVFQLAPPAAAGGVWTENVIYNFTFDGGGDGFSPASNLIFDTTGTAYGTTTGGGDVHGGTVFKLTPPTSDGDPWTETVLHSFNGGRDGTTPSGGLISGKNGALFGVTQAGGVGNNGVVFGLTK